MSHIFISYSNADRDYARLLTDHLLRQGFDVWIDDRIDYGKDWERMIFEAIADCAAFVVIMTPASYVSRWVQRERHYADRCNRLPFPLLLEGEIFPYYGPTQCVDVTGDRLPPPAFINELAQVVPRRDQSGVDVVAAHDKSSPERAARRLGWLVGGLVAVVVLGIVVMLSGVWDAGSGDDSPSQTSVAGIGGVNTPAAKAPTETATAEVAPILQPTLTPPSITTRRPTQTFTPTVPVATQVWLDLTQTQQSSLQNASATAEQWTATPSDTPPPTQTLPATPDKTETYRAELAAAIATLTATAWTATPTVTATSTLTATLTLTNTTVTPVPTLTVTPTATATPLIPALMVNATFDTRVIAWETIQRADDGQVLRLDSAGAEQIMIDFPAGVYGREAKTCSQDYRYAAGQRVVLFTGELYGQIALYPVTGNEPIITLGANDTHRMACAGPTTFQFSPNEQTAGFIDFYEEYLDKEYLYGNLLFFEATTGNQIGAFDRTIAFDLFDDGALMLRAYPDGEGYATEVDVDWWDGTNRHTLTTLEPIYPPDKDEVNCGVQSGTITRMADVAYILLGQRCEQTNSNTWRVVRVPLAGGSPAEIASGTPAGGFFNGYFTTQIISALDGGGVLITVPSGLRRYTTTLYWVTVDGGFAPILSGQHVAVDWFDDELLSYEARHMQLAFDGSQLAFVTETANNEQSLWTLDLTATGSTPVLLHKGNTGEYVFQYVWAANNVLYYVAGSIESSVLAVVLPDQVSHLLLRGRFYRMVASYDGSQLAAAEAYDNPNKLNDANYQLTVFDMSGRYFTLKQGDDSDNEFFPLAIAPLQSP